MMPRDTMTSLVQRIARQAMVTFRGHPVAGESKAFLEHQNKLRGLLADVRAADLKIAPRHAESSTGAPHGHIGPPVTYMHICETDAFSMGVFLLRHGSCIPLHDHPGMYGMLRVLYGKVRISCFDRLDVSPDAGASSGGHLNPPVLPFQNSSLRPCVRRSVAEFTEESGPCVLSPHRDNIHQIEAVDGPSAFLDILAPPYDPDDGRDCHYYKVLSKDGADKKADDQEHTEIWLMEIPQPSEFWCGGEPYPGPKVSL